MTARSAFSVYLCGGVCKWQKPLCCCCCSRPAPAEAVTGHLLATGCWGPPPTLQTARAGAEGVRLAPRLGGLQNRDAKKEGQF